MKIAIAGGGIAGSYLARLLGQKGIDADIYDPMDHATRCGYRSCGWGAPSGIGTYLDMIGLLFDDYLLERMPVMNFDGLLAKTPLCTIDKTRLVQDLTNGSSLTRRNIGNAELEDYDVVVDATGIGRTFLPPCNSDLTLPTLQHRVIVKPLVGERLGPGVYGNRVPGLGYLWIFPLSDDQYHIGIGGIGLARHDSLLEQFYNDHSGQFSFTPVCTCDGSVRVASPFYSTPFFTGKARGSGRTPAIVGVGESIGTVSPFTGEGIVFSMECAKILSDKWPDFNRYTRTVLSRFSWMKKERETLDFLLEQKGAGGPRIRDRWRFYRNAARSGIGLPVLDAFKRIGTLSRWVDTHDREP
jgi:flavin-dependent dehydrogenase